jgi:hypothetical protein
MNKDSKFKPQRTHEESFIKNLLSKDTLQKKSEGQNPSLNIFIRRGGIIFLQFFTGHFLPLALARMFSQ